MSKPVVKPCICGTQVVCIADEIAFGVAAHNATTPHQLWRARGGMEYELSQRPFRRVGSLLAGVFRNTEHGYLVDW
jgi:hypothetical protein